MTASLTDRRPSPIVPTAGQEPASGEGDEMAAPEPNTADHDPRPAYLRAMIAALGMTQIEAAQLLGVSPRMMREYLADEDAANRTAAPYLVQYALECTAHSRGIDYISLRRVRKAKPFPRGGDMRTRARAR